MARTYNSGAGPVATTSNGRSRLPSSLRFASAVAFSVAALFPAASPERERFASPTFPALAAQLAGVSPEPTADAPVTIRAHASMSADTVERAIAVAAPGTGDLVIERELASWLLEEPQ